MPEHFMQKAVADIVNSLKVEIPNKESLHNDLKNEQNIKRKKN